MASSSSSAGGANAAELINSQASLMALKTIYSKSNLPRISSLLPWFKVTGDLYRLRDDENSGGTPSALALFKAILEAVNAAVLAAPSSSLTSPVSGSMLFEKYLSSFIAVQDVLKSVNEHNSIKASAIYIVLSKPERADVHISHTEDINAFKKIFGFSKDDARKLRLCIFAALKGIADKMHSLKSSNSVPNSL